MTLAGATITLFQPLRPKLCGEGAASMIDEGGLSLAELGKLCVEFLDRAHGNVIKAANLAVEVKQRIVLGEAGSSYTFRDWYDAYCGGFPCCPPIDRFLSLGGWTTAKKREVAAKLLKAAPSRSDRAIAKEIGIDHKTIGDVRRTLEINGEIPHSDPPASRTGPKRKSAASVAKDESVTHPAALVLEGGSALVAAFNAVPAVKRQAIHVSHGRLNGAHSINLFGTLQNDPITKLKTAWSESRKGERADFIAAYNLARLKEQIGLLPRSSQVDLLNWLSDTLNGAAASCSIESKAARELAVPAAAE